MKNRTLLAVFVGFCAAAAMPVRAESIIRYSQNPDPFVAPEDTKGNMGILTLTNEDPDNLAVVFNIRFSGDFFPTGGEADDRAINLKLIAPTPTVNNPLMIGPSGNANIRFSYDTVDEIHDGNIDSGEWQGFFFVDYFYVAGSNLTRTTAVDVSVVDTPEPAAWILVFTGAGLLLMRRLAFVSCLDLITSARNSRI